MPTTTTHDRSRARRALTGTATGLTAAALVLIAPVAANAHVHVTPSSTEAGASAELAFSFGHGCEGSPTTRVEVTMPDEIASIALIANPGWDVASELVDGARTVVFTADEPLPDGVRETLEVEVTLPEDAPDGTVLAFPALQVCETGETLWGDEDQASETPAPILTIGESADAHAHGAEAGSDAEHGAGESGHDGDAGEGSGDAGDAGDGAQAAAQQPAEGAAAMPIAIAALVVAVIAAALAAFAAFRRRPTS